MIRIWLSEEQVISVLNLLDSYISKYQTGCYSSVLKQKWMQIRDMIRVQIEEQKNIDDI